MIGYFSTIRQKNLMLMANLASLSLEVLFFKNLFRMIELPKNGVRDILVNLSLKMLKSRSTENLKVRGQKSLCV